MQLAGFTFRLLTSGTLEGEGIAALSHPSCPPFKGQPGSLTIASLQPADNAPAGDGGGAQLNALLETALPPSGTVWQLNLCNCCLEAASLQHLPVLARLERLTLEECFSPGGLDAPLQALVQQAPALTMLTYLADAAPSASGCLRSWPAYLLAHPSLRSIRLWNREAAEWNEQEALSLNLGATQPGRPAVLLCLLSVGSLLCVLCMRLGLVRAANCAQVARGQHGMHTGWSGNRTESHPNRILRWPFFLALPRSAGAPGH